MSGGGPDVVDDSSSDNSRGNTGNFLSFGPLEEDDIKLSGGLPAAGTSTRGSSTEDSR